MLGFLLTVRRIGIDLGSEYVKIAESTISGIPKIHLDSSNKVTIPTAIAFQNASDINRSSIRFGKSAEKFLRKHPRDGYAFPTFFVGRENYTGPITPTESLAIYLNEIYSQFKDNPEVVITVPFYYTRPQRELIAIACQLAKIPLKQILENTLCLAALYSTTRNSKIIQGPKNVVFVDIGAMSVKVISHSYGWDNDHTIINETYSTWSEDIGIRPMSLFLAQQLRISPKQAMKKIIKGDPNIYKILPLHFEKFREMLQTVIGAVGVITQRPVDEIQLIGGGSQNKLFLDIIKNLTDTPIKRDFNANEAIALGSLYTIDVIEQISPFPAFMQSPRPSMSINLVCSKETQHCQQNTICIYTVVENESLGCETAYVVADTNQIPKGTSPILAKYHMTNISNYIGTNSSFGVFEMSRFSTGIDHVQWCDGNFCDNIEIQYERHIRGDNDDNVKDIPTILTIIDNLETKRKKSILLGEIYDLMEPSRKHDPGRIEELEGENLNERCLDELKLLKDELTQLIKTPTNQQESLEDL